MSLQYESHRRTGWIKCYRALEDHWIFQDPIMLKVWLSILIRANHKGVVLPFSGAMVEIERGTFIVSKLAWADRLRIARPKLDRRLRTLESDKAIVQQTCNRYTAITVVNYDAYQKRETFHIATAEATDVAADVHQTNIQHAADVQQTCTNKNDNNSKNVKNDRDVCVKTDTTHALDEHFLSVSKDADWLTNPQYAKAGRRPLRKYPDLFLTPEDLAEVFTQLSDAGIPPAQFKLVFMRVSARLTTQKSLGKPTGAVSAFIWLTSWAKEEVVKELTASCNLERSRAYLEGARI